MSKVTKYVAVIEVYDDPSTVDAHGVTRSAPRITSVRRQGLMAWLSAAWDAILGEREGNVIWSRSGIPQTPFAMECTSGCAETLFERRGNLQVKTTAPRTPPNLSSILL
jgi:hypothetical protein